MVQKGQVLSLFLAMDDSVVSVPCLVIMFVRLQSGLFLQTIVGEAAVSVEFTFYSSTLQFFCDGVYISLLSENA